MVSFNRWSLVALTLSLVGQLASAQQVEVDLIQKSASDAGQAQSLDYDLLTDRDPDSNEYSLRSQMSRPMREKPRKAWGVQVYTYYSGADSLETTNNSMNTTDNRYSQELPSGLETGQFSTSPGFGIGLEHSIVRLFSAGPVHFGYQAGTTYEFERKIDRRYFNRDSVNRYSHNGGNSNDGYREANRSTRFYQAESPGLSFIDPYINMLVNYRNTYFFGGINYAVPQMSNAGDETYSGEIGYQLGIGFAVSRWVMVEAVQRWVNFSVSPNDVENDRGRRVQFSEDRQGLGVIADEELGLGGLNLNVKFRF